MGGLVRKARKEISPDWSKEEQIHQLLQLFYGDWGFHCDPEDYFYARNLYLPYVFQNRQGMPVTLGAIVLYLADVLDLPIYPVNFPTQLILRAEVRDEVALLILGMALIYRKKNCSNFMKVHLDLGRKFNPKNLIEPIFSLLYSRFEQLAKNALIREEHNDMAYHYIKNLMITDAENPYHIRDRT